MRNEKEAIEYFLTNYSYRFDEDKKTLVWNGLCGNNRNRFGLPIGTKTDGYYCLIIEGVRLKMHRIIFYLYNGYLPKYVDHINRNTEDNSISNLRPATKSLNQRNQKLRKDNTCGEKGVYFDTKRNKFHVRTSIAGVYKHINTFDFKKEASSCYERVTEFVLNGTRFELLTKNEKTKIIAALLGNKGVALDELDRIASNIIKHSNTEEKDVQEAIDSLERWKQMQVEDKGFNDKQGDNNA